MVRALLDALNRRFAGLLEILNVISNDDDDDDDDNRMSTNEQWNTFGSMLYLIAGSLEPSFEFLWLKNHPGDDIMKNRLKQKIIGMVLKINLFLQSKFRCKLIKKE